MTTSADLRDIKRRLSPHLLSLPGVSGVGIPGGTLTVYLVDDSEAVRRQVAELVESVVPGTPVDYVLTGTFHPQ